MVKKKKKAKNKECYKWHCKSGGCGYFAGFIGAVIYYLSTASGFWMGVLGILKAIVWPVFLVFEVLKFVGA